MASENTFFPSKFLPQQHYEGAFQDARYITHARLRLLHTLLDSLIL